MKLYDFATDDLITDRQLIVDRLAEMALRLLTYAAPGYKQDHLRVTDAGLKMARETLAGDPRHNFLLGRVVRMLWRSEVIA